MTKVCSGCNIDFDKTHLLLNHRRTFRCGGEWNHDVYIPTHRYTDEGVMIYRSRRGVKYDISKPRLIDPTSFYTDDEKMKRFIFKLSKKRKHKHRTPGTVRPSRMEGGSGFRNNWEN